MEDGQLSEENRKLREQLVKDALAALDWDALMVLQEIAHISDNAADLRAGLESPTEKDN